MPLWDFISDLSFFSCDSQASEKDGFTSREFELAGQHCEQAEDILPWLHQTWRPMIAQLRSRVRQIDPQLTITDEEARRALFDSKVNITKGTELAIHYKLEKVWLKIIPLVLSIELLNCFIVYTDFLCNKSSSLISS